MPNDREIDKDPRWHQWLWTPDPPSGRVRQTLLDEAIASATPHRVISFFQQFLQSGHTAQATFHGQSSSGRTYTRAQIKRCTSTIAGVGMQVENRHGRSRKLISSEPPSKAAS